MYASFVRPEDQVPITLAKSLYSQPLPELMGFILKANTYRVGIWLNGQQCIVGCRGTSIGGPDFSKDINDDRILAGISVIYNVCDLSLVQEATTLMQQNQIDPQTFQITFCGHSLGGRASMCLANKYPNTKCVMVNAGAPPTSPVYDGPGPQRAIHYHIFGDVISSHMGPDAALIVRIRKPGKPTWGSAYPHELARLDANDGPWEYATVNEEQESWMKSGDHKIPIGRFWARQAVCDRPIPGSTVRCSVLDRLHVFRTKAFEKQKGRVEKKHHRLIRRK